MGKITYHASLTTQVQISRTHMKSQMCGKYLESSHSQIETGDGQENHWEAQGPASVAYVVQEQQTNTDPGSKPSGR